MVETNGVDGHAVVYQMRLVLVDWTIEGNWLTCEMKKETEKQGKIENQ